MSTLLLVDDHPVLRQGLVQFLSGVQEIEVVREASSGEEAIQEFRNSRPNAVILDMTLGAGSDP